MSNEDRFIIVPESLSWRQAKERYPVLCNTVDRFYPNMLGFNKAYIVSLVVGVCHYCFEEPAGCQCWNDE